MLKQHSKLYQRKYVKTLNNTVKTMISALSLAILTGCAAGAATAGYAIKAQSSDSLTSAAEQRIVDRTKQEIYFEMSRQQQYQNISN